MNHMRKIYLLISIFSFFGQQAAAVQINFWDQEKEDIQQDLDEAIKLFEKSQKSITVKRSHYTTEDLRTQFQTAALGGSGADLIIAPNDFAGPFSLMGIIQPVNEFIETSKFSSDVTAAVSDSKGQIWGIPVARGNHLMLFVNNSMVKSIPTTLEELVSAAKTVTGKGKYGFAYNLNEPFWFVTFLAAYGQSPLVAGKPNLENDAMVKALALVHDLKFKDKIVPQDCAYACAETLFLEEKAAMIINGDWAVQTYADKLKDKLAIAPLPKLAATGHYMAPMTSGKYLFLNTNLKGKKLAAVKEFAAFMTSSKMQEFFALKSGRLPATVEVTKSKTVSGNKALASSLAAMEHGQPLPMAVEMRAVWDAIRPQLQNVMAGRSEPALAAKIMQKDALAKIKDMKR